MAESKAFVNPAGNLLEAALLYASQGFPVFPCHGKIPNTPHGFKDASSDPNKIREWWTKWPSANIGIPTGPASGLFVLDVDSEEFLRDLERLYSPLPPTRTIISSPGHFHHLFTYPAGFNIKSSAGVVAPKLDIRAMGAMIIVPPSIHPDTGKPYVISRDLPMAEPPEWLIRLALNPKPRSNKDAATTSNNGDILEKRNVTLTSLAGTMRRRGMSVEAIEAVLLAENTRRCQPPLDESSVRTIAKSVGRYEPHAEAGGNNSGTAAPDDPVVVSEEAISLPDMPQSVLDGYLGSIYNERMKDFPIAFGWLSLLAAAGVRVRGTGPLRTNLNVALVGPPHCGKSVAIERANYYLDLKPPALAPLKSGSAEGLLAKIGDQQGRSVLLFPDELAHLLEKAQITNASFAYILNSLFYKDEDTITVARGKVVHFNCRLSIIGGVIDVKFDDSFGSASTGGLYDRFLFGQCPTGYSYLWRPIEGPPAFSNTFTEPRVNGDVWEARNHIVKTENLNPRVLEIALRTALICAAADGRAELRAADLEPAWELARYQSRVRMLLQPNAGKNFEGRVALKILHYLGRHAPNGEWLPVRQVLRLTRAYDFGPSIAEHALNAMRFGGAIEEMSDTVGRGQKRRLIRLTGESQCPD